MKTRLCSAVTALALGLVAGGAFAPPDGKPDDDCDEVAGQTFHHPCRPPTPPPKPTWPPFPTPDKGH